MVLLPKHNYISTVRIIIVIYTYHALIEVLCVENFVYLFTREHSLYISLYIRVDLMYVCSYSQELGCYFSSSSTFVSQGTGQEKTSLQLQSVLPSLGSSLL